MGADEQDEGRKPPAPDDADETDRIDEGQETDQGPVSPGKVRRDAAIVALLAAPTLVAAAEAIGVNERTLRRWLDEPAFAAQLASARRQTLSLASNTLAASTAKAAAALVDIFEDTNAPHAARVTAARTVIEQARQLVELDEVAERLRRLEEQMAAGDDDE